ncbi:MULTISPECIES: hypothetical protein [Nitrosomonas]|uniref:Uncharacterized protein n=1 Tax=Nitrosomonas communis TaxID=44574 RepID=A0A0F7K9F1_9PROT|nr:MULTISPECIES: hypothetical protein [Nitrosomonas]AKH36875.1 hypothetical protein AAW31_02165 [Nitrosomonas communis]TYP83906.1 hypothetical protein BCL69_104032 [Nitrosomonas communis]UVS61979.1 hypothetical protein NX761_02280 [Nitrosomonas sp. PLL12]
MKPFQRILPYARYLLGQSKSTNVNEELALHEAYRKDMQELDNPMAAMLHRPIPSIGRHNQDIMEALASAKRVAVTLAKAGYRVLDISIGSRNTRITLNHSPRCDLLGGALIKLARINGAEEKTMAANIEGVQVEWVISSKWSKHHA